ncbi:MAG: protein phosphatase 2C family protein [Rickettsiales bacterium]|nr:protein phosphatase 2C family protein [Rickettsiales bacterium]
MLPVINLTDIPYIHFKQEPAGTPGATKGPQIYEPPDELGEPGGLRTIPVKKDDIYQTVISPNFPHIHLAQTAGRKGEQEDAYTVLSVPKILSERDAVTHVGEIFAQMQKTFAEKYSTTSACTACIVVLSPDGTITVGNAGDSRSFLLSQNSSDSALNYERLNLIHRSTADPTKPSRRFGECEEGWQPDILQISMQNIPPTGQRMLILATDGLFETGTITKDLHENYYARLWQTWQQQKDILLKREPDSIQWQMYAKNPAKLFTDAAFNYSSSNYDNITALVVNLNTPSKDQTLVLGLFDGSNSIQIGNDLAQALFNYLNQNVAASKVLATSNNPSIGMQKT